MVARSEHVYQAHRTAGSIYGIARCFCYFGTMFRIGESDIQVRGSEYQPCSVMVLGTAEQPTIWIDDAVGLPLATLRLSAYDAATVVAALAWSPRPDPHKERRATASQA